MSNDTTSAAVVDTYVTVRSISESEVCSAQLQELLDFYHEQYDSEPEFVVRVPGRVNIIGEHVDYCGYPVLPMAIEQCILLAVGKYPDHSFLHLRNVNRKFDNYKCDLQSFQIDLPESGGPEWYKYYLCGVKGIYEYISGEFPKTGMSVAVSGNIPPSSGLSSSSALVSAATLATAYINGVQLNRKMLASISARCERYIGTQGGGMDQAIAYLAQKGCAQFIEFFPELQASPVRLPDGACFVLAHSLAEINKAATSDFNQRVVECRIACRLIAKRLNFQNWRDITRFAALQAAINCELEELEHLLQQILIQDIYTKDDILKELQVDEKELKSDFLTPNTRDMAVFKLRQRALHVIQESLRVRKFRDTCREAGANIETLSTLMRESHKSLRYLYECSHPALDHIIDISDKFGVNARLTGAGWGGFIVALCKSKDESVEYIQELKEKYYKKLPQAKHSNLDTIIFSTCPQNGAEIFNLKQT